MIKNLSIVKIGTLWNEGQGASYKDQINAEPNFGEEVVLTKPVTADLMLIRMTDSIVAILDNMETTCELVCTKCLDTFELPIKVESTERHFLDEKPERDYDPFEVFLINREGTCLDLSDMVRQEIILHYSMIPVCSHRCKGLCAGCKTNFNHSDQHLADCTGEIIDSVAEHKPFAQLKEIFKSNNK